MAADIVAVFLDHDEFADYHDINGQQVLCVVDTDTNKTRSGQESEHYDGIFLSVKKVFVRASDLPKRPLCGKRLRFDNEPYTVIECVESGGMYEITIGLNDS
ncbi:hypothetical protein [Methylomusa anaerophila]|uniref:Uncharacterized protein n=2 Tax=Methylomusa anaerophila TaxID=1930071 RepID=A0A348AJ02_9FIRM|nr:hypothetical protein [Methylomusa anaerophila]BBB91050.1 hypothetical protein MAMMFC1_01718 [Methylomusa anaerophila]